MKNTRSFVAVWFGVVLAAACGGSSTGPGNADAGPRNDGASGSGSGSGGGSGSGSGGTDAATSGEAGAACTMPSQCTGGLVCCQMGCQPQSACGMGGNRQICTASTECPASNPVCRAGGGGGVMTCRQPAACNPGMCPTGQVCCTATGAGVDACQAACATGSNPVCNTNADCPTGQTCCSGLMGVSDNCSATCPAGSNPVCAMAADCGAGTVCCQNGCQPQAACGIGGMNRQICTTSAECPPAFPVCRGGGGGGGGGGTMTCRAATDAGAPALDAGGLLDSAPPLDTGSASDATGG